MIGNEVGTFRPARESFSAGIAPSEFGQRENVVYAGIFDQTGPNNLSNQDVVATTMSIICVILHSR